jgi:hypothetical protein
MYPLGLVNVRSKMKESQSMSNRHPKRRKIREDKRQPLWDGLPKHTEPDAMEKLERFLVMIFGCRAAEISEKDSRSIFRVHSELDGTVLNPVRVTIGCVDVFITPWDDRIGRSQWAEYRFYANGSVDIQRFSAKERGMVDVRSRSSKRTYLCWEEAFPHLIRAALSYMSLIDKWSRTRKGLFREQLRAITKAAKKKRQQPSSQ